MAVDISTDLNITLLARDIKTPTITGIYDVGSPAGTYIPGRDYSPIDDVSTGIVAELNFSAAFDSISNQLYNLDRVYIQSVDDPRTDGTGVILGRWINQDPNPANITDDGQNTVIPNYVAQMSAIVFDETANIKSDSTLTTGITATLPAAFWWKSKIMPKIQLVAVKDGITKVSEPLQLPTIRLSTAGLLTSSLSSNGSIVYSTRDGVKGFFVPVALTTMKSDLPNIARILDDPTYDLITYAADFNASVNGQPIPLTAANFVVTGSRGTVVSLDYVGGVLTLVIRQEDPGILLATVQAFVPFDAGAATQATVTINGEWAVVPPVITGFINRYLFTEVAAGSASLNVVVDTSGQPPAPVPRIIESINANLSIEKVFQGLQVVNYDCIRPLGATFIRMVDSSIARFGSGVTPQVVYTTSGGVSGGGNLPAGSYQALYGHYNFPAVYDPNQVAELVITGGVAMMPYADLVALGEIPNVLSIVLTQDPLAGQSVNYALPILFNFDGDLDVLSQAEFADLYNQDPKESYPTYLYSYMSMGVCYDTVAQAMAAVGNLLSGVDAFVLRGGRVFLNLGTTAKDQSTTVQRFNATSVVHLDRPLDAIDAFVQFAITTMDTGFALPVITDYTKEYCLKIRWTNPTGGSGAFTNIPVGTTLAVTLPDNLRPFIYLSGQPYIEVPISGGQPIQIPILDYRLLGNTLTLTTTAEMNLLPDTICVPVKFLTPSTDLNTGLTSLAFSKPLVYKQNPDSLIYGFTTDSLLFRVTTITQAFTLKGAQMDTTGLSVIPQVYERGQSVSYIATVYNSSYTPSSDYCMAMTVPTNQYNPVESSNNTLPAHITAINPTDPRTVVYFQTAANATAMDISMMKTLNRPGGPTLQQYFDTVIVSSWVLFTGQALPGDVVMLVGCTDGVVQNSQVRIDYSVVMEVPPGDNTLYTNDAVFNYYSSGANLEAQSNMVTIRNRIAAAIPIVKTPPAQIQPLENGVPVAFTLYFTAPADPLIFRTFTITDALHPSIRLNATGGVTVTTYPNTAVPFTFSVDANTNTLTVRVTNSAAIAGRLIQVNLAATVVDAGIIPIDPLYQLPLFYNTAALVINDNPNLRSEAVPVIVAFQPPAPVPVPIVKAPLTQTRPKVNGTEVDCTLSFTAPALQNIYTAFTVTDVLHPALTLNVPGVLVEANGVPVAVTVSYDAPSHTVTVSLPNTAATAGKVIAITLPTTVTNVSLIPTNNTILNTARLTLNNNPALYSDSNTVEVRFTVAPPPPGRCQAITDLMVSVAMEQAALAHILNAEGEKLQKAMSMPLTLKQTLTFNRSVTSMVESISTLEGILKRKLSTVDCDLCQPCDSDTDLVN